MASSVFNIVQPFLASAEQFPRKIALIEGDRKVTYAELHVNVLHKAAYFSQRGIGAGDRVLVFVPMSIELYETVLALFYMGAVAVFVDEWVNRKRLETCCHMAGCKEFIAPAKIRLLALTSKTVRQIPVWLKTKKYAKEKMFCALVRESDTALITFTTGSTGIPKAANRTHGFLREQFKALLSEIKPRPTDVDLPTLPIVLLLNLGAGCTSVIPSFSASKPQKTDFKKITREIQTYKANRMESSPDFALRLAHHLIQNKIALPAIRNIFTGGAPVFPKEAEILQKAFSGASIHIVYGSTEAEPVSVITSAELKQVQEKKVLPVGKTYHGTKVRILPITTAPLQFKSDAAMQAYALPTGTVGEIVVSGAHVLTAYLNNPEAEKQNKIWVEGICWHRTGDSGLLDAGGNLFLCGRVSMIFSKNGKIYYPFTTEWMIRESEISPIGTVVLTGDEVVVFAEGKNEQAAKLEQYLQSHGLNFDRLVMLKKIPRDKRHFSKIEYSLLQ